MSRIMLPINLDQICGNDELTTLNVVLLFFYIFIELLSLLLLLLLQYIIIIVIVTIHLIFLTK